MIATPVPAATRGYRMVGREFEHPGGHDFTGLTGSSTKSTAVLTCCPPTRNWSRPAWTCSTSQPSRSCRRVHPTASRARVVEDRQQHPVRMAFFGYAGSSQITCLQLMAKKIAVAQSTSGDVPESALDSLNQDGDSVEMALARPLIAA